MGRFFYEVEFKADIFSGFATNCRHIVAQLVVKGARKNAHVTETWENLIDTPGIIRDLTYERIKSLLHGLDDAIGYFELNKRYLGDTGSDYDSFVMSVMPAVESNPETYTLLTLKQAFWALRIMDQVELAEISMPVRRRMAKRLRELRSVVQIVASKLPEHGAG